MNMAEFLSNSEWDTPFFKRLAHNDTGRARGHQAGMVFPKDLREYLPTLDETATSFLTPTTDRHLRVEMYLGSVHRQDGIVRYQLQTWGGERSPESRITDGLRPIRDLADKGDILLFQRRFDVLDYFRLILVKQGSTEFDNICDWVGNRPWGPLFPSDVPTTQSQLLQANSEVATLSLSPFQMFVPSIPRIETRQSRIARNSVFRERVRNAYKNKCAVSGFGIGTPTGLYEVESAHVVPLSEGGSDDVRNGLALIQTLHWAFDHGLFGVSQNRRVHVPRLVKTMIDNEFLRQFEGREITEANDEHHRVHPDAFRWHMQEIVRQWD